MNPDTLVMDLLLELRAKDFTQRQQIQQLQARIKELEAEKAESKPAE